MNEGKSDAQELAEAVAAKRELLKAMDRMANHSPAHRARKEGK